MTAAVAAIAPATVIQMCHAPAPCNQGLLWQIKKAGNTVTYPRLTEKLIEEILQELNDTPNPDTYYDMYGVK